MDIEQDFVRLKKIIIKIGFHVLVELCLTCVYSEYRHTAICLHIWPAVQIYTSITISIRFYNHDVEKTRIAH